MNATTLNVITEVCNQFRLKFNLKQELMDLVNYIYFRQNIKDTDAAGIIRRRTWLNLIEMRREELDREAKEQRYKQSKLGAFKAKIDPMLQNVDDRDEAEFYLKKLGKKLRSLVQLVLYHGVQVQAISVCSGQSRFQIHRQMQAAMHQMKS